MLSFTGSLRVFLAVEPCDLRKSFDRLYGLASEQLGEDPRSGAIFVFCNRRRNRIKILYFDGSGLWVMAKRHIPQCPLSVFGEDSLPVSSAFQHRG